MKKTGTTLTQALIGLIPTVYLFSIWNKLPERVPVHYNANFEANRFGSKFELLVIVIFIFGISIGISLLISNLNKIDPKRERSVNNAMALKISWALAVFMSLLSCCIVYQTDQYTHGNAGGFSPKYVVALIALFFVVLGNFMNNLKPNYFLGIRTPWTLDDEENWRLTHHVGAKIWFFGGLIMFGLVMLLPLKYTAFISIFSLIPLAGLPIFYSYYIFRKKQKGR